MSYGPNRSNGGAWLALAILIVVVMLLLATLGCASARDAQFGTCECICQCEDENCYATCGGESEIESSDPAEMPIVVPFGG